MQTLIITFEDGRKRTVPLIDPQAGPTFLRVWVEARGDEGPPWPPVDIGSYRGVVDVALFEEGVDITDRF